MPNEEVRVRVVGENANIDITLHDRDQSQDDHAVIIQKTADQANSEYEYDSEYSESIYDDDEDDDVYADLGLKRLPNWIIPGTDGHKITIWKYDFSEKKEIWISNGYCHTLDESPISWRFAAISHVWASKNKKDDPSYKVENFNAVDIEPDLVESSKDLKAVIQKMNNTEDCKVQPWQLNRLARVKQIMTYVAKKDGLEWFWMDMISVDQTNKFVIRDSTYVMSYVYHTAALTVVLHSTTDGANFKEWESRVWTIQEKWLSRKFRHVWWPQNDSKPDGSIQNFITSAQTFKDENEDDNDDNEDNNGDNESEDNDQENDASPNPRSNFHIQETVQTPNVTFVTRLARSVKPPTDLKNLLKESFTRDCNPDFIQDRVYSLRVFNNAVYEKPVVYTKDLDTLLMECAVESATNKERPDLSMITRTRGFDKPDKPGMSLILDIDMYHKLSDKERLELKPEDPVYGITSVIPKVGVMFDGVVPVTFKDQNLVKTSRTDVGSSKNVFGNMVGRFVLTFDTMDKLFNDGPDDDNGLDQDEPTENNEPDNEEQVDKLSVSEALDAAKSIISSAQTHSDKDLAQHYTDIIGNLIDAIPSGFDTVVSGDENLIYKDQLEEARSAFITMYNFLVSQFLASEFSEPVENIVEYARRLQLLQPNESSAQASLGFVLYRAELYEESQTVLKKVLEMDDLDTEAEKNILKLLEVLENEISVTDEINKNIDNAIVHATKLIEDADRLQKSQSTTENIVAAHNIYTDAINTLEGSVENGFETIKASSYRGIDYSKISKQLGEAYSKRSLTYTETTSSDNVPTENNETADENDSALGDLLKSVDLFPTAQLHFQLGQKYFDKKEYQNAVTNLSRALELPAENKDYQKIKLLLKLAERADQLDITEQVPTYLQRKGTILCSLIYGLLQTPLEPLVNTAVYDSSQDPVAKFISNSVVLFNHFVPYKIRQSIQSQPVTLSHILTTVWDEVNNKVSSDKNQSDAHTNTITALEMYAIALVVRYHATHCDCVCCSILKYSNTVQEIIDGNEKFGAILNALGEKQITKESEAELIMNFSDAWDEDEDEDNDENTSNRNGKKIDVGCFNSMAVFKYTIYKYCKFEIDSIQVTVPSVGEIYKRRPVILGLVVLAARVFADSPVLKHELFHSDPKSPWNYFVPILTRSGEKVLARVNASNLCISEPFNISKVTILPVQEYVDEKKAPKFGETRIYKNSRSGTGNIICAQIPMSFVDTIAVKTTVGPKYLKSIDGLMDTTSYIVS
ncbi:hypothetical protein HK100_002102 [Physocladia obscura]|uniref:Uncharacterized protein n=1 Tax=Physocladia obscura TaxID=109957 RepID=A0AAD5SVV0_9FUNG|nr:hypothetical protein HK100_002102 [Physocladia obscura]